MLYTLNICPKCKDKFVKQDVVREEDYRSVYCSYCGREMIPVLAGEERLDDIEKTIYKIVLNEVIIDEMQDKCVKVIMQIGNYGEEEALEKVNTKNSVIFEGDLLHTYLSLWLLSESCYYFHYTVSPPLPYQILFAQLCPDCGEVVTYKKEEVGEGKVREGFFCEKCNEWISYGPL